MEHVIREGVIPDDVRDAIVVLWKYADDVYCGIWTKDELDKEGFECSSDVVYYYKFVLPVIKENKDEKENSKEEV